MTTTRPVWGADTAISMPLPANEGVQVPMYGFGMTQYRLVHDLSGKDYEDLSVPVYAPATAGPVVSDDAEIDQAGPPAGTP